MRRFFDAQLRMNVPAQSARLSSSNTIRVLIILIGLGLFGGVLVHSDLSTVGEGIMLVGWGGVAVVLVIHALSFLADVVLWMMAYDDIALSFRTCTRFYVVRLIGEAFNNATPLASVGGEPIKAQLLKERYGVGYAESAVAFLLAKSANLVALVFFLAVGFLIMLADPRFSPAYRVFAGTGLSAFLLAIVLFLLMQRSRLLSTSLAWCSGTRAGGRLADWQHRLAAFEERLSERYREMPQRFFRICVIALLTWIAGIFEIQIILTAAGDAISLHEAWLIEAVVQLVRAAAFFIPGGLGVIEISFVFIVAVVTGSSELGVVVAVIRRFRDLVWIAAGMLLALPAGGASRLKENIQGAGH
jgi:uncharacterized protein (TIRG00374 family)